MKKSTHIGECQGCGRTQMLPFDGRLSLHGYQVQWSSFVGTCPGSRQLPYEQDREFVAYCIEQSKKDLVFFEKKYAEVLALPTDINKTYISYRFKDDEGKWDSMTSYLDFEVKVYDTYIRIFFVNPKTGEREEANKYDYSLKSAQEYVAKANKQHAIQTYSPRIEQLKSYIQWQQKRYLDWEVRELRPVTEVEKPVYEGVRRNRDYFFTVTFPDGSKGSSRSISEGWQKIAQWRKDNNWTLPPNTPKRKGSEEREAKKAEKLARAAQRAQNLLAKYEKLVPAEIRENLVKYEHNSEEINALYYQLSEKNYSVYRLLSDDIDRAHGKRPFDRDPREIIAEFESSK